jgi:hypothetical protein
VSHDITSIDIAVDEGWEELEDGALDQIRIVMRARFSDDPIENLRILQARARSMATDAEKMERLLVMQEEAAKS